MRHPAWKRWAAGLAAVTAWVFTAFISSSPPAGAETDGEFTPVHIATSCAEFSTEGRADAEWSAYMRSYTAQREAECVAAGLPSGAWKDGAAQPEDRIYGSADEGSRLRLREIARKYGLRLCGGETDSVPLPPVLEAAETVSPEYSFGEDAFGFSGRVRISGWTCDFVYEECAAGVMGFWSVGGTILDKYSQWRYASLSGEELFIDMGPADSGGYSGFRQVLLFGREDGRIVTVRGSVPNGREGAEQFAECFLIG